MRLEMRRNRESKLCQNCVTYPPQPWGITVIYEDTPKQIDVARSRCSTTPTSLRLKPTTCEQSDTAERKTLLQIPMFLDAIWIQRSTDVRERIVVGIV